MKISSSSWIIALVGLAAAVVGFFSTAGADDRSYVASNGPKAVAVFAGGCFWCVEADFDKVDGVLSTISGYSGGATANPTYRDVTYGKTGHFEVVEVTYDPTKVSYAELVTYYFRHIDPTDDEGQFCDKGDSYRTAVFVSNAEERAVVEAEIAAIDQSGILPAKVVTQVKTLGQFWPAEGYHQDYYIKSPSKYAIYRNACGRDKALKKLWGGAKGES